MSSLPPCPKCNSEYSYQDGNLYVCPECAHEWSPDAAPEVVEAGLVVRDAHGNVLQDGDAVTVIKDLKVKGSSTVIKGAPRSRSSCWSREITISTAGSMASAPCS